MPAGREWFPQRPSLRSLASTTKLWHVYSSSYGPLDANPKSKARLALVGTHGMFYAASTLAGALWETVLRNVEPDPFRRVLISSGSLSGMRAVPVSLLRNDVNLLPLGQPELRDLFPVDSEEAREVAALLNDPNHSNTHGVARRIHEGLVRHGITEMPVLSWPSRQLNGATVYLAYSPPMDDSWWRVEGEPVELDDPNSGHPAVHETLRSHGFSWTPLATDAASPGPV
jgi:hypothetical protein